MPNDDIAPRGSYSMGIKELTGAAHGSFTTGETTLARTAATPKAEAKVA
jgi:hypothetical protein